MRNLFGGFRRPPAVDGCSLAAIAELSQEMAHVLLLHHLEPIFYF